MPAVDRDLTAVPRHNSIALRIAMAAAAEVDLCSSRRWGMEWDIAAAALIAEEAGACVSDALNRPIRYNKASGEVLGLLVSAPAIHGAAAGRLAHRAQAASRR